MEGRNLSRGHLKRPLSDVSSENESSSETNGLRRPTVYDAVAGNVTQSGFFTTKASEQKRANQRLRPDEVLFKKLNAPTRYEETDYYFAHRNLPPTQKLPSGDLLSALHEYVSMLYARSQEKGAPKTWKCMDETALIALGILLEETAKETLGETGDLALVEAVRDDEEEAFANEEERGRERKEKLLEHMEKLRQDKLH
ncbi:hypothetical protein N0V90_003073 [Kalmusia sp. IMI 367209]|nr:hypothetical protein N0V90_003073 [Kalmusia sp. IMI 367209]